MTPRQRLERLLLRADVSTTARLRQAWFGDAVLEGSLILTTSQDVKALIERHFLEAFRRVDPQVEVRVVAQTEKPKRGAVRGVVVPKQGDML